MSAVITLPPLPAPIDQLWHVLLDLEDQLRVPWSLVGGQMVLLHALEYGVVPPQVSQDGDIMADIRSVSSALTQVVRALEGLGFHLVAPSANGLAHRYLRPAEPRPVMIDILAPEGLGPRADLTTTPPGRTVEVRGGTQSRTAFCAGEGRTGRRHRTCTSTPLATSATAAPPPRRCAPASPSSPP